MCTIIICKDERVSSEKLAAATRQFPDGSGIAWRSRGRIRFQKGVDNQKLLSLAASVPLPYIIHCRQATVGAKSPSLTHPFPIRAGVLPSDELVGECRKAFFHNGHWPDWFGCIIPLLAQQKYHIKINEWSDSRAIAYLVAMVGEEILYEISSKFAILTPNKIKTWGTFTEEDGVLWSTALFFYKKVSTGDWFDSLVIRKKKEYLHIDTLPYILDETIDNFPCPNYYYTVSAGKYNESIIAPACAWKGARKIIPKGCWGCFFTIDASQVPDEDIKLQGLWGRDPNTIESCDEIIMMEDAESDDTLLLDTTSTNDTTPTKTTGLEEVDDYFFDSDESNWFYSQCYSHKRKV